MEQAGLTMHMTFHWLHAFLMQSTYFSNEVHVAVETSYMYTLRPAHSMDLLS